MQLAMLSIVCVNYAVTSPIRRFRVREWYTFYNSSDEHVRRGTIAPP